jgi:hypothetical protein
MTLRLSLYPAQTLGAGKYENQIQTFSMAEKLKVYSETVEKVPKQILGGDAEKIDFTECATIKDLTIMEGRETPTNQALTILKGFSTVSADTEPFPQSKPILPHSLIAFNYLHCSIGHFEKDSEHI